MSDTARTTGEIVRDTYARLIAARDAQLKYMSSVRRRRREFAFIVSPDLVLQYNYVHQLMSSYRAGAPRDVCVEDGGITCSNMSVLRPGLAPDEPSDLPADGSDYLASRIVDLLDRPVAVGDRDLTLRASEDYATGVRALNALFEERYRVCRERGDRLEGELTAARQRSVADADSRSAVDDVPQRMREQIARYETQMRAVRRHLETLREVDESVLQRNRRHMEQLLERAALHGRGDFGEAFARALRNLFEGLESERDRALATLDGELSRHARATGGTAGELEERVRSEVADRAGAAERALRARLREELDEQTEELRREFDAAVAARVEDEFNAIPRLEINDMPDVERLEATLASVLRLRESALDVVLPALADDRCERSDDAVRQCLGYVLGKMRDLYKFLIVQSEYIGAIGDTAHRRCNPLLAMKREEWERLAVRIDELLAEHAAERGSQQDSVAALLERVLAELTRARDAGCEQRGRRDETALSAAERNELNGLRDEVQAHQSTIDELRRTVQGLRNTIGDQFRLDLFDPATVGERMVRESDLRARMVSERAERDGVRMDARSAYNRLATFVIELVDECERWFRANQQAVPPPPPLLRDCEASLKDHFSAADRAIGHGRSPRLVFGGEHKRWNMR